MKAITAKALATKAIACIGASLVWRLPSASACFVSFPLCRSTELPWSYRAFCDTHIESTSTSAAVATTTRKEMSRLTLGHRQGELTVTLGLTSPTDSLLQWYEMVLQTKPLQTKSISSAIIGCLGNVLSQAIQAAATGRPLAICWRQVAAFGLTGLLYIGPFYHYWFDQLWRVGNWLETRHGSSKQGQVLTQIFMDQTVGVALFFPLYYFAFELAEAFISRRPPQLAAAHSKCIETVESVVLANWRVWPFINYVNFRVIPAKLRVLVVNLVSVIWNAFFCAMVA